MAADSDGVRMRLLLLDISSVVIGEGALPPMMENAKLLHKTFMHACQHASFCVPWGDLGCFGDDALLNC